VPTNLECYQPAIPELDGDTTADSVQANTILYVATKPEDFEADNAYWLITRTKNSVRQEQYIDVQRTGVPSGMAAGTVRLGAPGLTQPAGDSGWGFLAQVAFCSEDAPGTIDKCTCYSEDSSVQTTASFDGVDPDGTASGTLQINFEDQFRRGNTTTTITGGLGLGPIDVWLEGASGGRPTIIDTERALAPQGTNMVFVERAAESPHVYTEVPYRCATSPATGDLQYNVDADGRAHIPASSSFPKALLIKLVNEPTSLEHSTETTEPELQVRTASGNNIGSALQSWPIKDLDGDATGCDGNLPLANDAGQIVYLRFESNDEGAHGDPQVRAAVGWGGCTEDGGLASCSRQCSTGWWPYEDDPEGLKGQNGWWGFFVHHRTYRVEAFRAGSAPAQ
jgi:hypothetical protein